MKKVDIEEFEKFLEKVIVQFTMLFVICMFSLMNQNCKANEVKGAIISVIPEETIQVKTEIVKVQKENVRKQIDKKKEEIKQITKFSEHDKYLLAKIAMAEAEGCNIQTKTLIIFCILNRVESEKFPNTIEDVIYENKNGVYQFSPLADGRWETIEPNEDCYEALDVVLQSPNYSDGCLYFESCMNEENWHSRNLTFLYESNGIRFYK